MKTKIIFSNTILLFSINKRKQDFQLAQIEILQIQSLSYLKQRVYSKVPKQLVHG